MEAILKQILTEVSSLSSKFDHLESDVKDIKSDVGTLKSDVGTLKSDVGTLKSNVSTLTSRVDDLGDRLLNVEQSQLRMENTMTTNFAALYDAREMHQEFNERIESKVDVISSKMDTLALQVNYHEHRFNRLKSI
ncbi:hypothetical protein [Anaerosinus massiliensis]|uniref:hypothetical protein n=1 Tax=Massilibacillus massiliensis TaxID=1806837 RepID=UPI000DA633E9|nr:hypothetical protein [Massilibacillus massiliensis]